MAKFLPHCGEMVYPVLGVYAICLWDSPIVRDDIYIRNKI